MTKMSDFDYWMKSLRGELRAGYTNAADECINQMRLTFRALLSERDAWKAEFKRVSGGKKK
jgi:hypothetical protein